MQVYEYENTGRSLDLDSGGELARFAVLYTRVSTRKHKKWEGDGILICYSNFAVLKTDDEKDVISRSTSIKRVDDLVVGREFKMGAWEVQIQEKIAPQRVHSQSILPPTTCKRTLNSPPSDKPPQAKAALRDCPTLSSGNGKSTTSNIFRKKFTCPLATTDTIEVTPFVINEDRVKGNGEEPVVAEPLISRHLRDHQKDGVRFIFSHLQERSGVILADEMGLGKSIQAIVATVALLKQSKNSTRNVPRKCLLVVPSSLVNNWKCEFRKWFHMATTPIVAVKCVSDITSYACSVSSYPYLIISYEMALRNVEKLAAIQFDILVCDEGHRLKNINGKLRQALDSLGIPRRLLLTGTPLQNDIEEFFSLLDFVRPTCFGTIADFKSQCNNEDGDLNTLISDCLLRRTGEINNSHLPIKNDYVLFCAPSAVQRAVLAAICDHMGGEPLALINMMRKVANHPAILFKKLFESTNENVRRDYSFLLSAFPQNYGSRTVSLADSGKLSAFVEMMACFRQMGECVVVVSNFTKTLDMLASLCSSLGLCVMRLDGQTPTADRQALVTQFNSERNSENVFLLSTKAGGVGLNLIGASRLILFDSDWNPASDLQAMARIWRDGQTRPCHIYRLVTAGTVDEKIFHRQIKKSGLFSMISLNEQTFKPSSFLDEELESIFTLNEGECQTHDLLECSCDGCGLLPGEADDEPEEINGDEDQTSIIPGDEGCSEAVVENSACADQEPSSSDQDEGSLTELLRWRHYSPRHAEQWEYFKSVAGFTATPLNDLTFAFHLCSKF
ncbi:DNA repair and recombination protein RAD54B [Trichostrongylus colubriformis]|uniref:DNA repair and recombination protein RAD54-like n=1 Tax=Trichostrongylus colubriformis TaxID=6319 RepID=A0AAN8ERF3_TRICO